MQYKNSLENPGCAEYKMHVFYQAPKSNMQYTQQWQWTLDLKVENLKQPLFQQLSVAL